MKTIELTQLNEENERDQRAMSAVVGGMSLVEETTTSEARETTCKNNLKQLALAAH